MAGMREDDCMTQRHFTVTIAGRDSHDLEDLEESSRRLRDELMEIDGIQIDGVPDGPSRDSTRAVAEVLAAFAISYYLVRPLAKELSGVLHLWQQRHRDKRVLVEFPDGSQLEINGHDPAGTRELIDKIEQTIPQ
jgi:hypothetical protein